jgi:uncharacterized MnhB-related membrane protein
LTSPFVLALNTLTLAKHPEVATTEDSVGNWVVPHVFTSVALELELILDSTNLKLLTLLQVPEVAG